MNTNKYRTIDDFYNACNEDKELTKVIKNFDINSFGRLLDHFKIARQGEYYLKSSLFLLGSKIKNFNKIPPLDYLNKIINFTPQINKFLLLQFSNKFQHKIRAIRIKYDIPENGFSPKDNYKEWFKNEKIDPIWITNPNFYGSPFFIQDKVPTIIDIYFGKNKHNLSKIEKIFDEYKNLCLINKIKEALIEFPEYIIWDFNLMNYKNLPRVQFAPIDGYPDKDEVEYPEYPFERSEQMINAGNNKPSGIWSQPEDNFYQIAVLKNVPKKEIIKYLKNNWPKIKREMKSFYKTMAEKDNFKKDFIVYSYYLALKKISAVKDVLWLKHDINLQEGTIKVIISRLKAEIKSLDKTVT